MDILRDGLVTWVRHHSSDWSGEAQPVARAASRAADANRSRTSATRSGLSGFRMGASTVADRDVDVVVVVIVGVDLALSVCVGIVKADAEAASANTENA